MCSPRVLPLTTIPDVGTVKLTNPDTDPDSQGDPPYLYPGLWHDTQLAVPRENVSSIFH